MTNEIKSAREALGKYKYWKEKRANEVEFGNLSRVTCDECSGAQNELRNHVATFDKALSAYERLQGVDFALSIMQLKTSCQPFGHFCPNYKILPWFS